MVSPKAAVIGDRGLVKKPHTTLIKPITNLAGFHKAIHGSEIVVVYVYALWCVCCRQMTPVIESVARSKEFHSVKFYKVDETSEELRDVINEELYITGLPGVFVFYLGQVFRFFEGYNPDFSDWLTSTVLASEKAMDGAVISHPDLLNGNPPIITEITDLEQFFRIIRGQQPVVLYLYSTRSSELKYFSRIFECWAVHGYDDQGLYCILDGDKHTKIVEEIEIDMEAGVVGFYSGNMLGWSEASRRMDEFGEWISDFFDAIEIADSASVDEETVPSSDQIMPITEITSLTQFREIVSTHSRVAVNLCMDQRPSYRAVSLVFERAAADSTLNDIYFAQVDANEQNDIVRDLEAYEGTIILFSDGEHVMDKPESCIFECLKKDLLRHIGALDEDESEADPNQSDELAPGEVEDQLERINTPDNDQSKTEAKQSDQLVSAEEDQRVNVPDDLIDASETDPKSPDELRPEENEELQLGPVEDVQTPVLLEATRSEELNISGTVSEAGALNASESYINLSQTSSIIANRLTCQGRYQLRPQRAIYKRVLNIQPKTFSDSENGCLFTPKSKEERLQIGLANEADSRFSIELSCDRHVGGETIIYFHINFIVDPTANARYQSAMFEVNFSQLEDNDGHESPLTVRDFEPKDQQGEATEVQVGKASSGSVGLAGGYSMLSLATTGSLSTTQQYTKKTASHIRGACVSPSTVNWAYKEDEGPAGRNGLATTHVGHARIPSTGLTSIRFWAKAILMRPRRPKVELRIGSTELPSEKVLDLHVLHLEKA